MSEGFRNLEVWQQAMELVECVYRTTADSPADEKYGLISQVRRAAVSVPSCIAEGHARHTTREYLRFVGLAAGSLAELRTQLEISSRLAWLQPEAFAELEVKTERLSRMLTRLRLALDSKLAKLPALPPISDL
ncbi:MAG: four helix bundle protein [Gammaproteobacteria bacterium]|nr:MAG: four helix bundle protein [Gammaproteobacteria bacterium]